MKFLIIGFGQDAVLMACHLHSLGCEYRILLRRSSAIPKKIEDSGVDRSKIVYCESIDEIALLKLFSDFPYTHVFNFAANSFVQESELRFMSFIQNNSAILWSLMRVFELTQGFWIFHPLSSEILDGECSKGGKRIVLKPRNAYGLAKATDLLSCDVFREKAQGQIHACILFNHESSHRPNQFFTKKVCNYFRGGGGQRPLEIFNAKSQRDWGSAKEFMTFIQQSAAANFDGTSMLGTGSLMSVEEFIDECFRVLKEDVEKSEVDGLIVWRSSRFTVNECARDQFDAKRTVKADPDHVIPAFGSMPSIHGHKLVNGLLNGEL